MNKTLVERFKEGYKFSLTNLERSVQTGVSNQHYLDNRTKAEELLGDKSSLVGTLCALLTNPRMVYQHVRYCQPQDSR